MQWAATVNDLGMFTPEHGASQQRKTQLAASWEQAFQHAWVIEVPKRAAASIAMQGGTPK